MISLFVLFHPFGGQNDENRVLVKKMADKNSANFIVKALFFFRPTFTLGLIELSNKLETFLVSVMSQFVL